MAPQRVKVLSATAPPVSSPPVAIADGVRLGCATAHVAVAASVAAAARDRCHLEPFESPGADAALSVLRGRAADTWRQLKGAPGPGGRFLLAAGVLECDIVDDVWSAESVLRLAWLVSTIRQGGLLMHGCAVGWGGTGVAAIGISTAGKSTLAALCAGAPGNATLLTDEIVQLFPDGTCFGTPFRSNVENVGQPGPVALRSLLLLTKGPYESLAPVPAAQALTELLPQLFWFETGEGSLGEQKRRLLALVDRVGVHRLTFRNDAAVGPFLRDWVSA